jgi:capsular polysaccharide biosynthesis protein
VFRRYALICTLVMVVSLGAAGLSYAAPRSREFSSSCSFQVFLHLSQEPPATTDEQKFVNNLALQQVSTAIAGGVYNDVAESQNTDPAGIARNVRTLPTPGLGTFLVTVRDVSRPRAIQLANALCDSFVARVKAQRATEVDTRVKGVQDRIATIQADVERLQRIAPASRTPEQSVTLAAQQRALTFNSGLIASIISLPPDDISVLTRATSALLRPGPDLERNLIIGGIAGLLGCFIVVLVGETITERRGRNEERDLRAEDDRVRI